MVTDTLVEGTSRCLLEKPKFLFGDEITVLEEALYVYKNKWLRKVERIQMFLLDMVRSYLLTYLQDLSVLQTISWNVTREQDGVVVGSFGNVSAYQNGPSRSVTISFLANLIRTTL